MKSFAIWLVIVAIVFGVYAAVTVSLQETSQVFVFVDTSVNMNEFENDIERELDRIDDRDDAEFALAQGQEFTGLDLVHSWQAELRWERTRPFGGCMFPENDSFTEIAEADDRILITTTESTDDCDTSALTDWDVVLLDQV